MIKATIGNQVLIINKTDTVADIEKAIAELQKDWAVLISVVKTNLFETRLFELKASYPELSFKMQNNTDDLSSFVPRFGVFNKFLALPLEKLFINPKPFKGYFKPMFYRRCFMQLKTFQNLRFER